MGYWRPKYSLSMYKCLDLFEYLFMFNRIGESLGCQVVLLGEYRSEWFVSLAAARLLDLTTDIEYLAL